MKTDWLNKVQTRLRNEQHAQAPQGLLDDIKNEMRRRGMAPTCRPPRHRKVVALWGVRAASIAAFLAVGLYIVHRTTLPSADKPLVSTIAPSPLAPSNIVSRQPMPHAVQHAERPIASRSIHHSAHKAHSLLMARNELPAKTDAQPTETAPSQPHSDTQTAQPSRRVLPAMPPQSGRETPPQRKPSTDASRWSFATSYDGLSGSSHTSQGVLLAAANPYGEYVDAFSGHERQNYANGSGSVQMKTRHHRPVKFGLSVGYNIHRRWRIQTGLTYSRLVSDFTCDMDHAESAVQQELHYIGLPVSMGYSFYKTRRINLYTMAGGEVEKLVKGRAKQKATPDVVPPTSAETITEHAPIFSIHAAVGGEIRFNPALSAYVEPGISHHFNNGSNVKSVYKDKPTSLSLNVGIRVYLNK